MNKIDIIERIVTAANGVEPLIAASHEMPERALRPFIKVTYLGLDQSDRDTDGRVVTHVIAVAVGAMPTDVESGDQLAERILNAVSEATIADLEAQASVLSVDLGGGDLSEFEERLPQSGSVAWLAGFILNVMVQ